MEAQQLLEALDDQQRAVAQQVTGPLSVLAGAGTGKTRAITYRVAYGVATGAFDPHSVLAVTFTTRAATEMRARLRTLGVGGAQARTFHSAALRQLRYFWPQTIGGNLPRIMEHKAQIVASAAARLGIRVDKVSVRDIAAEIEWAKVSMISPAQYAQQLTRHRREPPADLDATTVADLLTVYEDAKNEQGVIDFEDVLLLMVGILQDSEWAARTVRAQYQHFVVDEFQDVSKLQHELLNLWLGGRHDICVVGDVAQTIYSFTGASPRYLVHFEKDHPGARRVELYRNYRSTPQIVSMANSVLRGRRGALPDGAVKLESQRKSGKAVAFNTFDDVTAEARGVARQIKGLLETGVAAQDIAILFRTNAQSEAFEEALADAQVPFQLRGGKQFFDRDEIKKAIVLLRQIARTTGDAEDAPVVQIVEDIASDLGWSAKPPQTHGAVREKWDNLDALVSLAHDRAELSLTQFAAEMQDRQQTQTAPQISSVTLCSLHAAKGLEWDHVFLTGVCEGLIPITYAKSADALEEERRLLYVGVTRARDQLVISYSRARGQGRAANQKPSRFLEHVWPNAHTKTRSKPRRQRKREEIEELPADAKRVFDALRQWRLMVAKIRSVPAFKVFTDKVLIEIAVVKPKTMTQLGTVRGVGATKLDRYGGDVLAVIRETAAESEP
ncbi:ATP-dependent helicase [Gleimia hominis]|uniref:ATP-dependent helicase n=1 Tax=Gleimia hominis TaxID=595468 RepID=UPI001E29D1C7|nr:ATP-dependent DNA helicase UvrD2 [Gleimia hominis]WIK63694.1 ATP-dependent DNA helicase UvrD2 [Gleimia hominis]